MRYASHTSPALFWSVMLGAAGPVVFLASIPLKRKLGIAEREMVPQTYPSRFSSFPGVVMRDSGGRGGLTGGGGVVPNRARKIPAGFDDE